VDSLTLMYQELMGIAVAFMSGLVVAMGVLFPILVGRKLKELDTGRWVGRLVVLALAGVGYGLVHVCAMIPRNSVAIVVDFIVSQRPLFLSVKAVFVAVVLLSLCGAGQGLSLMYPDRSIQNDDRVVPSEPPNLPKGPPEYDPHEPWPS